VLIAKSPRPAHGPTDPPAEKPKKPPTKNRFAMDSDWDRFPSPAPFGISPHGFRGRGSRGASRPGRAGPFEGALEEVGIGQEPDRGSAQAPPMPSGRPQKRNAPRRLAVLIGSGSGPVAYPGCPRAAPSLYRINDALTQAIACSSAGNVIRGVRAAGGRSAGNVSRSASWASANQVTHAIAIEPSEAVADEGAQIALIVNRSRPKPDPSSTGRS